MPKRKKLTKEERKGDKAFELFESIKTVEQMRRHGLLDVAKLLNTIYEGQLYKDILGDENASWSAFLSQTELYYNRNKVYGLLLIAKRFLPYLQVDTLIQAPTERLIQASQFITDKNTAEEWFHKATTALPGDWRLHLREARGLSLECNHKFEAFSVCAVCGKKQHA